ncbi:MiaB family protein [Caenispirillum salinarum AK4]|uniref:tRNA (N(6)-L-threonylcarbamoyladenosine(37)-C(2))-methylthiotransferase n=1 Tax=Caenispirillum salinarum AK4 TaxID=1238182 RepID=K9H5S8_9PROT|nr:tRNA (N(6)-L-threonylcarbamoyladenosine(37)-C(2))-methylthiotransferase MtaB [Caenispirillum salinarum]EKV32464.1 MiaB family protein [Caenispirillum salinarum AK4]
MTMQKPIDPRVVTFGCRMNTYESEVMRDHARAAGLGDAVIVNTCAVTKEAERQARQAVRRLRRENPHAKIIVTGCAVQLDKDLWSGMPEVDRVLGNAEKLKAESYAPGLNQQILVDDIMTVRETAEHLLAGFEGHTRAFVQVQQGCDHRCTFCIIPYARGPNRSVPMGRITEQVRALVENGYREVVLTGVDITAYGADLPGQPPLGQMVRRLLANVPELPRLRLTSLDPVEVDDDLLELIGREPRLMPHFHLSAQAGDDLILKRMKRRHLRADVIALTERIRSIRPDAVFGADIIAGFPTETDEHFANSVALVEEAGLTHLHVFPYSSRPGTPAAKIPGLPGDVVKARAARLRDVGRAAMDAYLRSRVGTETTVLVEEPGKGHSDHYIPVRLPETAAVGEIVPVRLTGVDGETMTAEVTA